MDQMFAYSIKDIIGWPVKKPLLYNHRFVTINCMGQILLSGEQSPSVCWIIFDVIRDFMDQIDIMGQPVSKCLPYNSWFVIINLMDTMFVIIKFIHNQ